MYAMPILRCGLVAFICCLVACDSGKDRQDNPQTQVLRVRGKLIAPKANSAHVTLNVGAQQFSADADSSGAYDVEIALAGADDAAVFAMGQLTADPEVELLSYLGSFSALVEAGGDDAIVDPSENIRANLSGLSTAEAVLVQEAFGMVPPTAAIGNGADPATALNLAAALSLIQSDRTRFPLPDGTSTTLALARDAQARQTYIDSLSNNAADEFLQGKIDLISNTDIVRAISPDEVPAQLVMSADPFESPPYSPFPTAESTIDYGQDRQGTGNGSREFFWIIESTLIRARFSQYTGVGGDSPIDCNGDGTEEWVSYNYTTEGFDLALLAPTAAVTIATTVLDHQYCPDDPGAQWTAVNAFSITSFTPAASAP